MVKHLGLFTRWATWQAFIFKQKNNSLLFCRVPPHSTQTWQSWHSSCTLRSNLYLVFLESPLPPHPQIYYLFDTPYTFVTPGWVHSPGSGSAAGSRPCGQCASGAWHKGQGASACPSHCCQKRRRQVSCSAAAERAEQRWHADQGENRCMVVGLGGCVSVCSAFTGNFSWKNITSPSQTLCS